MFCVRCGQENDDNAVFCKDCGSRLEKVEKKLLTPKKKEKKEKPIKKEKTEKKSAKWVLIPIVAVLVLALGVGGYFGVNHFFGSEKEAVVVEGGNEGIPVSSGAVVVSCDHIQNRVTDVDDAFAVLNSFADVFGFDAAEEVLDHRTTGEVDGDKYFKFDQEYRGVPVYGKSVVVAADGEGNVFHVSGNYAEIADSLSTSPTLAAKDAKAAIKKQVKDELTKDLFISEPERMVLCGDEGAVLVWSSSVKGRTAAGEFRSYKVFLSDETGTVVSKEVTVKAEGASQTYYGKDVAVDVSGNTISMLDEERNISVNAAVNKQYRMFWEQYTDHELIAWHNGEEPQEAAVEAQYNLGRTYDYYSAVLQHSGCDGRGEEFHESVLNVEYFGQEDYSCNAFYTYQDGVNYIVFGQPNELASMLDVVAHEYTHGVNEHLAAFRYSSQSGALDEAYADILGELTEGYYNGQDMDWIHTTGRNIKSPGESQNPAHMSEYLTGEEITSGDDEVHYNSTIISHAAYLMWEGTGEGEAIRDVEALSKLWYGSLYMLNQDSDFNHCRAAVEATAQRLLEKNVLTEGQVTCVSAAFDAVGIGAGLRFEAVTAQPELCVYAADGSEYYSYRYKVEKLVLDDFYSATEGMMPGATVVEEGYVTEENTVTLVAIEEDLSGKTVYRVTISDLNDENGQVLTRDVVVSENVGVPGQMEFYTTYEQPMSTLLEDINAAMDGVTSLRYTVDTTMEYSVQGTVEKSKSRMVSDIDMANGVSHTYFADGSEDGSFEFYTKSNETGMDFFILLYNTVWMKQLGVSEDDVSSLDSSFQGLEIAKFYFNALTDITMENRADSYVVSGTLDGTAVEEALQRSGFADTLDTLETAMADTAFSQEQIISDLAPVKILFLVDKETYLPKKMSIDMKDTLNSLYDSLQYIAESLGEDLGVGVTAGEAIAEFSMYNQIGEIVIPAEAYAGKDAGLF